MRFSQKMTLSVTLLLAILISIGGTLLVRRSFQSAFQSTIAQSTTQHLLEKYAIEADLLSAISDGSTPSDEHLRRFADSLTGYFSGNERLFALYSDKQQMVFNNLPEKINKPIKLDALGAGGDSCILRKVEDTSYLLMSSRIDTPYKILWLVSAFDVGHLFTEREAQLHYLWRVEAVLLALGILLTAFLSLLLTRNVKKLSQTAHQIAKGAYEQRVRLKSRDEIGSLAEDFDRMAAAIEENVAILHASIQSRDDFVAAFTHEMKTPMTALVGYAGILRRMEEEPAVRRMAADYIYHESRRLETLSQKLLELMGLSEGSLEMEAVPFERIYNEMLPALSKDTQNIRLQIKGDMECLVLADCTLCSDLLYNLVVNALGAGGREPVRVHVRQGRTFCSILVCDSGRGIPAAEIKRITEPFYMVDKSRSRKQGGSGVGLALARRIAALHGSELRFRSRIKRGTAVRFTLPRAREEEASHA